MADFDGADLRGARFNECQLDGAEFREATMSRVRIIGSVLEDVEIDSYVNRVTVNGVDVVPLVEAELDRRHPERLALRPTDAEGARAAVEVVEEMWRPTVERVRRAPDAIAHERVADEWSFVETLRHLVLVHDGWFVRAVLRDPSPYHPFGLTAAFLDPTELGIDESIRPTLDDVLLVRDEQRQRLREFLAPITDDDLVRTLEPNAASGFPPPEARTTLDCLRVLFGEEWAHHQFAVRDLDALEA